VDPLTGTSFAAAAEIVKTSFDRVFTDLNLSAETWFQRLRLKTFDRDFYADYILRNVGMFPLFGTTKSASVEDAYVHVMVTADIERMRYRSVHDIDAALRRQRLGDARSSASDTDLLSVINLTQADVALTGLPGSGKTTALRWLAVAAAKGATVRERRVMPIFLTARDMALELVTIKTGAQSFLRSLGVSETDRVLEKMMKRGDLMILLDGVDEVAAEYQRRLLMEVSELRADFPRTVIVVSARPYSLDVDLAGMKKCETMPLSGSARQELVRKWFEATDADKGQRLLSECKGSPDLLDLGSSPLLLSMICALYANDLKIPTEQDELYARLTEGLLGAWDAFRNVARQTVLRDYTVRRRVTLATWIAAETFDAGRRVFGGSDLTSLGTLERFGEAVRMPRLSADDVLRALFNDFGILVERSPGLFSFSHLTFQEYLTAQYIVENRRELPLLERGRDAEWFEVIRLVAKMLPRADAYMARLTAATDVTDKYALGLLRACWATHPLCDRSNVPVVLRGLAQQVVLEYQQASDSAAKTERDRMEKIRQHLPSIMSILTVRGHTLADFGVQQMEPFRDLGHAGI
jgi:predicted NACHT family NTPase